KANPPAGLQGGYPAWVLALPCGHHECWSDLPGSHQQRVVPRGDHPDNAYWFSENIRHGVFDIVASRDGIAGSSCPSEEPESIHHAVDVIFGYRWGFAAV